jgi:SIR2-like domain
MREGELIILLGAGTSVEAGIPASRQMIAEVETLLDSDQTWKSYRQLYQFVKASLIGAEVMRGKAVSEPDIERVVNTLSELAKNTECALYPFMSGWHQRLIELAGHDFKEVKAFRSLILHRLRDWISLESYSKTRYYEAFFKIREELKFAIRVFSLNYDLCLENNSNGRELEVGFDPQSEVWDFRRFESREETAPDIYLYKLPGSINWYRDRSQGNILKISAAPHASPDLIFGTMQYIDPYLFYAYELRRFSLESKVILAIGYSFRDDHINGIIAQALQNDPARVLIAVSPSASKDVVAVKEVSTQCRAIDKTAATFLTGLTIKSLEETAGIRETDPLFDEGSSDSNGDVSASGTIATMNFADRGY